MSLVTKKCEYCGLEFTRPRWKMKTQRFCSPSCAAKAHPINHKTTTKVICKNCGKEFYLPYWRAKIQRFCSTDCANEFRRGKKGAPKLKGKNSPCYKGGQVKHNGKWVYDDDDNLVLEHRLIMEKILGRKLKKEETVHHVDGDNLNNDPSNLYLFKSAKKHSKCHAALSDFIKPLLLMKVIIFNRSVGLYEINGGGEYNINR